MHQRRVVKICRRYLSLVILHHVLMSHILEIIRNGVFRCSERVYQLIRHLKRAERPIGYVEKN